MSVIVEEDNPKTGSADAGVRRAERFGRGRPKFVIDVVGAGWSRGVQHSTSVERCSTNRRRRSSQDRYWSNWVPTSRSVCACWRPTTKTRGCGAGAAR